jgi:hypothetical protein
MLNEGTIIEGSKSRIKSEMVHQLRQLGPTTPDQLERRVFTALTGNTREDVDWNFEDNQAGYYTWLRSFDQLIQELSEDGYIKVEQVKGSEERTLVPMPGEEPINFS